MISIKNLNKSFDKATILENVDLDIGKGEVVVIIGGSGCGKSTFLRCISRLEEPDSGEIYIDGENILAPDADVDKIRSKMGMVYQQFNLFSHLNVLENVILAPMKVRGMDQASAIKEAEALLDKVGMLKYKYSMPENLSGGQKQRVAIARALAMKPEVMLFDEPTSALDPAMVDEVENVIRNLIADGMTSVIVTHEMRFAKSIASRVVFFAEKGVYEMGTPDEIFNSPQKPLTCRFLYRSRMYEESFTLDEFDQYKVRGDMNSLITCYDYDAKQLKAFPVVIDELIYPVLGQKENSGITASIRLMCSETSQDHILMVDFEGLTRSPMDILDDINKALLTSSLKSIMPVKRENGWGVVMNL